MTNAPSPASPSASSRPLSRSLMSASSLPDAQHVVLARDQHDTSAVEVNPSLERQHLARAAAVVGRERHGYLVLTRGDPHILLDAQWAIRAQSGRLHRLLGDHAAVHDRFQIV